MDWEKAESYLKKVRQDYTSIGISGILGLRFNIDPLLIRFEKGERTQELYDSIMNLE